ncbi:hypothetical protein ACLKA6_013866 [Drosophila palustris]
MEPIREHNLGLNHFLSADPTPGREQLCNRDSGGETRTTQRVSGVSSSSSGSLLDSHCGHFRRYPMTLPPLLPAVPEYYKFSCNKPGWTASPTTAGKASLQTLYVFI